MKSLQELRRTSGMSRRELAEAAEISELTLLNLEQRITAPQHDVRRRLEMVFNQRINWLTTCGVQPGQRMFWEELEKEFRKVVLQINNQPVHERVTFLHVAREYLDVIEELAERDEERLNSNVLLPTEISALKPNRKQN